MPANPQFCAIAAVLVCMTLYAVAGYTLAMNLTTTFNEGFKGQGFKIEGLQKTMQGLHKTVQGQASEFKSLRKIMTGINSTEINEGFNGLHKTIDIVHTEITELRYNFASSQKGQSAAANSALSIQLDDEHIACGTLAYSARLKQAVVITNRHVVADLREHCSNEITVRTRHVAIPISRWLVPAGNVDIAIGLLAGPPPIPALNITSRAEVAPGIHIWAMSLQPTGIVALDGRVTSTLGMPYMLQTNVGGVPGFSGTGYVDYAGTLSVVHVGAVESGAALRRDHDGNEMTEQKVARYSEDCLKGTRLGTTGMGSHIDACLDLVFAVDAGVPAQDAAAVAAIDEIGRRCMDGWSMLAAGTLTAPPPDFVSSCALIFANQSIHPNTREACEVGWREDCGKDCDFIGACLSFAVNEPQNGQARPATRKECRAGWYNKYAGYASSCERYIRLRARNPQAKGVAAWVVDDPDLHFAFVDRSEMFPRPCQ